LDHIKATGLLRREIFKISAAMSILALASTGCASITPSQVQNAVDAVVNGFNNIVGILSALGSNAVPPDILAKIQSELKILQGLAGQIAGAINPSGDLLSQFAAIVNILIPLITPFFPLAGGIGMAIQAILVLLRIIWPAAAAHAVQGQTMTPEQAIAILNSPNSGIVVN